MLGCQCSKEVTPTSATQTFAQTLLFSDSVHVHSQIYCSPWASVNGIQKSDTAIILQRHEASDSAIYLKKGLTVGATWTQLTVAVQWRQRMRMRSCTWMDRTISCNISLVIYGLYVYKCGLISLNPSCILSCVHGKFIKNSEFMSTTKTCTLSSAPKCRNAVLSMPWQMTFLNVAKCCLRKLSVTNDIPKVWHHAWAKCGPGVAASR